MFSSLLFKASANSVHDGQKTWTDYLLNGNNGYDKKVGSLYELYWLYNDHWLGLVNFTRINLTQFYFLNSLKQSSPAHRDSDITDEISRAFAVWSYNTPLTFSQLPHNQADNADIRIVFTT